MNVRLLVVPNENDESPIEISIQGVMTKIESGKWYQLNIVKFKYLYKSVGQTNGLIKYHFIIVNQRGNNSKKLLREFELKKFDSYLLDNRTDVKSSNKLFGKNVLNNAQGYSLELVNKKIEEIVLDDYDKDNMLPKTGESEKDLNDNTILNLG